MHDPIYRDPLAAYDALGRKQLKRQGFVEHLRAFPCLLAPFTARVPDEMYMLDGSEVVVACPCGVDPPPRVPFNRVTRCEGEDCGRWFFWDLKRVRVATEPEYAAKRRTVVVD